MEPVITVTTKMRCSSLHATETGADVTFHLPNGSDSVPSVHNLTLRCEPGASFVPGKDYDISAEIKISESVPVAADPAEQDAVI